jgi:hypothetical protein
MTELKFHRPCRTEHRIFKKEHPEVSCSARVYSKIWKMYIHKIFNNLLEGYTVLTPIGNIKIIKKKVSTYNIKIDWGKTQKLGEVVYHFNEHSGGYKILLYIKRSKNIANYNYKFTSSLNRLLAKHIFAHKDNYKKYETYVPKYFNI